MEKSKEKLTEYLKYIKNDDRKHFAIYFNFSKLNENNRSSYRIKIAINIINVFFRDYKIELFVLDNFDIIVIYEHEDPIMLKKVIYELRYLFIDDPLAFKEENIENPDFCSIYNLHNDWDLCFEDFNKNSNLINQYLENKKSIELNSNSLPSIEKDIVNANIFPLLRTQNIVAFNKETNQPKTVFSEIYVSISHLCDQFDYKIEINHNSLLFRYITFRLDEQVLDTLKNRINNYIGKSISINLNVDTILSERFYNFDQIINLGQKKSIIIEINISDVFTNISAFIAAREYLQKLGYRVCLDGVNEMSFIQVDRESLGIDLIKLQWNPESRVKHDENSKLNQAIKKSGSHRIILCRCDNDEAIEYGKALGIALFQGWQIDKLGSSKYST